MRLGIPLDNIVASRHQPILAFENDFGMLVVEPLIEFSPHFHRYCKQRAPQDGRVDRQNGRVGTRGKVPLIADIAGEARNIAERLARYVIRRKFARPVFLARQRLHAVEFINREIMRPGRRLIAHGRQKTRHTFDMARRMVAVIPVVERTLATLRRSHFGEQNGAALYVIECVAHENAYFSSNAVQAASSATTVCSKSSLL